MEGHSIFKAKKKTDYSKLEKNTAYPYISELKSPSWNGFFEIWPIPESYIPDRTKINHLMAINLYDPKGMSLESIFWYLLLKRYLNILPTQEDLQFHQMVLNCEVRQEDYIAFRANRQIIDKNKKIKNENPDIFSTFYAIAILNYLGKLNQYLMGSHNIQRKQDILRYLEKLEKNHYYRHCLDSKCKIEKAIPQTQIIFVIMSIYSLFNVKPISLKQKFLPILKNSGKENHNAFRYLCLNYLNSKDFVSEDELLKLHKLQKPNGGFTFQNSAVPVIEDTFWIGYVLETQKWRLPYRTGPILSYIVNELKKIYSLGTNNEELIKNIAQMVILLTLIWNTSINELEEIIFSKLTSDNLLDLNVLSIQGGLMGAEQEILNFINQKYQFNLEIKSTDILFRRFLNKLDPYQQKFATDLRDLAKRYTQFDITEFRRNYNKGKDRTLRIKDEQLISLIKKMDKEHFFQGSIFKKPKLFLGKVYYFTRDTFIEQVILSDKVVSIEDIRREKRRLEEVLNDIYNMTREMEQSAENIMREVESLIIVGEVSLAEERLRNNIKKALFDATFFNKNIENFQEEFEFIKGIYALKPKVERWNAIYSSLQKDFSNINRVLTIKINELKEEQKENLLALQLEQFTNEEINKLIEVLDNYQERFKIQLETNYTRQTVEKLEAELHEILTNIKEIDSEIILQSHHISSKKDDIVILRKRIIDKWISQLEEFQKVIQYYQGGFDIWQKEIALVDQTHENFIHSIENIGQTITNFLKNNDHNQALEINNQDFLEASKLTDEFSQTLNQKIEPYYNQNRKLYPLIRSIQTEWLLYRNILDRLIHQMRDSFQSSIYLDLKSNLVENFKLTIEKGITDLRQNLIEFEQNMNSILQRDSEVPERLFEKYFSEITNQIKKKEKEINQKLTKGIKEFSTFNNETKKNLEKWNSFKQVFQMEIDQLTSKYQEERLIFHILKYADEKNTNYFKISELSKIVSVEEKELIIQINNLITYDRINARIFGDPAQIEVHNDDWRKWAWQKEYIETNIRESETRYIKVNEFYQKTLKQHELIKNINQIRTLASNHLNRLNIIREDYNLFIQHQSINLENELCKRSHEQFLNTISKINEKISRIITACDKTELFNRFLEDQMSNIEDLTHSEIHRLFTEVQNRKLKNFKKNVKWFEAQKSFLESRLKQLSNQTAEFKKKHWADISQASIIIIDLEKDYEDKKEKLLETYTLATNDILEKLSSAELNDMRKKMEDLIQNKQDELNHLLQKTDTDIRNKIKLKEYQNAAKKLGEKSKFLESSLKTVEKEIKSQNKIYNNRSKIFGIKFRYLIEQWELFLLDYLNGIQEIEITLQNELIFEYTTFIVNAFKGNYIPINKLAQDLDMKHDLVQHRLIDLISSKKLTGKLEMKLDIYFEGDSDLDDETIAAIDMIQATNVKTYLLIQRIANIFKILGPVLTAVASMITVTTYLAKWTTNLLIITSPFIIVSIVVLIVWMKKGRDKAIKLKKSKPNYAP